MKTRIHVNQHKIRSNMKHGTNDPVITVKTSKSNTYTHEVKINGPSKVIYSPDKPLSCGAKVWIETESEVIVNPGDTYINNIGTVVDAQSLLANGRDIRLQGQSDTIANFQIGLDNLQNQTQATLIVNYVSDRVRARGIDVLPDIIEEPPLLVDFAFSKIYSYPEFELKLSLELRNLLDEEYYASMRNIEMCVGSCGSVG